MVWIMCIEDNVELEAKSIMQTLSYRQQPDMQEKIKKNNVT